ncbi:hypothetical protein DSECCO2_482120 [anaerobic digester metagenome]
MQVRGLLGLDRQADDLGRRDHPAQAEARHRDLGEGPEHDAAAFGVGVKGLVVLAREAQLTVGVVLDEDGFRVFAQQFAQCLAFGPGIGQPRGVLEVGHGVEELGPARGQQPFGLLQVGAVLFQVHGHEARLEHGEGLDGAQVARALQDDLVAVLDEEFAQQVQALLGTGGDEHLVRIHANAPALVAGRDPGAQLCVAFGGGVLQGAGAGRGQGFAGGLLQGLDGEEARVRQAAGKGDDARVLGDFQDLADERFRRVLDAVGETEAHVGSL